MAQDQLLQSREVELPGGSLEYLLRRHPRSRGLRVTIDPRRGVVVSAPPGTRRGWADPHPRIRAFLAEREPWLRRHLARLARDQQVLAERGGLTDGGALRYRGVIHRIRIEPAPHGTRRSTVSRDGVDEGDELVVHAAPRDRRRIARVVEEWARLRALDAIEQAVAAHAGPLGVEPAAIAVRDPRSRWGSATRAGRIMLSWRLVLAPPEALETVVVHELAHLRRFGHGPGFWALVASRRPDHAIWRRWLRTHAVELHGALDDG